MRSAELFYRDVFVSHAGPDKEAFARPLVRALGRHAVGCWIDEAQIAAGESLLDAINAGLSASGLVAVLVTEEFQRVAA